jgi:gamma-glutamylputrescine oxidase
MNKPDSLSFWEKESFFKNIDIAIIGSGIVGLNAALRLKEIDSHLNIAIFERGALPEGASTRNAGFACFGSVTELLDDLDTRSEDEVFSLVQRRFKGLLKLRQRVGDSNLKYEEYGGYEIFKENESSTLNSCLERLSYFNGKLQSITGLKETYKVSKVDFGFQNTSNTLIHNTAEGQIDTGNMMSTLLNLCKSKGITLFNGIEINEIIDSKSEGKDGVTLLTKEGWEVTTAKLIVATNGFARRLLPDLAVIPARNQVLITKPIQGSKLKGCFHYDKGYFYFRNVENRILLGGGRNLDFENEMTDAFGTTDLIQKNLLKLLDTTILPHQKYEIDGWWSGILGIGSQKKPIIQHVSPNVVVAVRMGGMGIAIGSLVGEDAAELMLNHKFL